MDLYPVTSTDCGDENYNESERLFSPSLYSNGRKRQDITDSYIKTIVEGSADAKIQVECTLNVSYGDRDREELDIFLPESLPKDAPIFVFIHGGYWQEGSREIHSHMAKLFTESGIGVIIVGYELCPKVQVSDIVKQVEAAVAHIMKIANDRGSSGVYVCGHSAGGQLTAMLAHVNWKTQYSVNPSVLKGLIPLAGVYDLRPLVDAHYINKPLGLNRDSAWLCSPLKYVQDISCQHIKILIVVGQYECPGFKKQAALYLEELKKSKCQVSFREVPDVDHMQLAEKLGDPDFILVKEIFQFIRRI